MLPFRIIPLGFSVPLEFLTGFTGRYEWCIIKRGGNGMFLKTYFFWTILLAIFFHNPSSFSGEIYRWIDEKGTVHFTDDGSKIPEQYSGHTEKIEVPPEILREEEKVIRPEERSGRVKKYLEDLEKKIEMKRNMEKRVSELEEALRLSEERLKSIEEYEKLNYLYYQPFKDPKTGKWVPVGSPYFGEKRWLKEKIESTKAELISLQEKLSELKRGL